MQQQLQHAPPSRHALSCCAQPPWGRLLAALSNQHRAASSQPSLQPQAAAGQHARRPAVSRRQYHSSRITAAPSTPARGSPCGRPPWPPPRSPAPQTCRHRTACPAGEGRGQLGARNQGHVGGTGVGWQCDLHLAPQPSGLAVAGQLALGGFKVEHVPRKRVSCGSRAVGADLLTRLDIHPEQRGRAVPSPPTSKRCKAPALVVTGSCTYA